MPKVLNKYRDGIPKGAVYIGRPSKWGNPFVIGKDGDRDEVIEKYRQWLLARPDMMDAAKRELSGKDLVCFCAPKGCHGDVLLEVANPAFRGRATLWTVPCKALFKFRIRRSEMRCWKCGNEGTTCDINMQQTGMCYRCQQAQQSETWKPYQAGWECPKCHAIHSPDVKRCFCVPPSEIDTRGLGDV